MLFFVYFYDELFRSFLIDSHVLAIYKRQSLESKKADFACYDIYKMNFHFFSIE